MNIYIDLRRRNQNDNKNFVLPSPIEWIIVRNHASPAYNYIGALFPSFKNVFTFDGVQNSFFWDECDPCIFRKTLACSGGLGVNCKKDLDYFNYRRETIADITHPVTLTFTNVQSLKNRKSFFATSTIPVEQPSYLTTQFNYLPYVRSNTEATGAVCLGSLRDGESARRLEKVFFKEYLEGKGNKDYFYFSKITKYNDWVENFQKYVPELIKRGPILNHRLTEASFSQLIMRGNTPFYGFCSNPSNKSIKIYSCQEYPVLKVSSDYKISLEKA